MAIAKLFYKQAAGSKASNLQRFIYLDLRVKTSFGCDLISFAMRTLIKVFDSRKVASASFIEIQHDNTYKVL